jgi:hypothetical protein
MALNAELRTAGRLERELAVTLMRPHGNGNPVESRTRNIGSGGMCVATPRPLAIDELLSFEIETDGNGRVVGNVRVLREHIPNVYALRFEELSDDARTALERLA